MSDKANTIIIGVGKIGTQIAEKLALEGITSGIRRFDAISVYPEILPGTTNNLDLFEWPEAHKAKLNVRNALKRRVGKASSALIACNLAMDSGVSTLPEIARAIRTELDSIGCIGIEPYSYEGKARVNSADVTLRALSSCVDMLGTISRNNLAEILKPDTTLPQANNAVNEIAALASTATALLLSSPRNLSSVFGFPAISSPLAAAIARGENAPAEALKFAAEKSLLTQKIFNDSKSVLATLILGRTPTIGDMQNVETAIKSYLPPGANHRIEVIEDISLGKTALVSIAAIPAVGSIEEDVFPSEDPDTLCIPAFIRRRKIGRGKVDRRMGRRNTW